MWRPRRDLRKSEKHFLRFFPSEERGHALRAVQWRCLSQAGGRILQRLPRADASIGASLESCAACSALSAADVQCAAAAAGGAASVATPPRTTANTVQSRPPCAATGAKRKAADHRCIECGNASVDAAGANLC